jgi:hypothetical protein
VSRCDELAGDLTQLSRRVGRAPRRFMLQVDATEVSRVFHDGLDVGRTELD